MVPVTFDGCAGWLHPAAGRHAVLLCGALNHQILSAHQSWHALATMIAAAGLPALRFDYRGTGDSIGDDGEPGRVQAWLQSIRAAARFMREEFGFETLDIVGIRLGATLAALTAPELGIERAVFIAPVVSGRLYIREARARSKMLSGIWRLGEADAARGDIANDGFFITKETAATIARLDLTSLTASPAGDVLLVAEDSVSVDKLAEQFEMLDCEVARKDFPGFAGLMDSATLASIPFEDWRAIAAYMANGREAASAIPVLPKRSVLQGPSFREERIVFGEGERLAGVLCRPLAEAPIATTLFVNTGANPHLGCGRMSVEHARALAARGIGSLRMDIAGTGDAMLLEGSPRAALYRNESIADVCQALNLLQARGFDNITVVGHCSGAWLALNSGLADSRIRQLFLVNLQRFIWTGEEDLDALMAQTYRATDSYVQEIGSGAIWHRLRKGDVNWPRLPGILRAIARRAAARIGSRVWPIAAGLLGTETETGRIRATLTQLSQRGTNVHLVYSDTDPGREELARHFGPSGRRLHLPGVEIAIIDNADHDITSEEARNVYFNLLTQSLSCKTGGVDAESPSAEPLVIAEAA